MNFGIADRMPGEKAKKGFACGRFTAARFFPASYPGMRSPSFSFPNRMQQGVEEEADFSEYECAFCERWLITAEEQDRGVCNACTDEIKKRVGMGG